MAPGGRHPPASCPFSSRCHAATFAPAMETDPDLSSLPHRPRLPGTYAAHYEREPSARVGRALLIAVIALDALSCAHTAVNLLLFGAMEGLLILFTRAITFAVAYFAFWFGWAWPRWLLVVVNFFTGVTVILWTLNLGGKASLGAGVLYGTGALHLAAAAFFAFSTDLLAFIRQQRERRSASVLAPALVILGVYAAALPATWIGYDAWQGHMRRSSLAAAQDDVRAIGAGWSAAEVLRRASPEFRQHNPPGGSLQWHCADIASRVGTLVTLDDSPLSQQYTLHTDRMRGTYARAFYRFGFKGDRQSGIFSIDLSSDLAGGRWEIDGYSVRWEPSAEETSAPPQQPGIAAAPQPVAPQVEQEAVAFATESVRVFAQNWEISELEKRSHQRSLNAWLNEARRRRLRDVSAVGPLRELRLQKSQCKQLPESAAGVVVLRAVCTFAAQCERGDCTFAVELNRRENGPWEIVSFGADRVNPRGP